MKVLIVYASKTGSTKKCACLLGNKLNDASVVNIENFNHDVRDYDIIVVGTPIRIGMIDKNIKKFLNSNLEVLKSKKCAYFITCGFSQNYKKYFDDNFPKDLLDSAIIYDTFGGEMSLENQKGFDKFIVKMVSKKIGVGKEIKIIDDNINKFLNVL